MRSSILAVLALSLSVATPAMADVPISLNGSPSSMTRQNRVAKQHDYTFLRTPDQVERFVESGHLVPIQESESLALAHVSFPYARPEMSLFLERLSAQYRQGCGERLVVTSLVRPRSMQPRNSHPLSVHPTGMALDLRVSRNGECVRWLERTLLSLEKEELLDATRERRPPHFHVALFPDVYRAYVDELMADSLRHAAETIPVSVPTTPVVTTWTAPVMEAPPSPAIQRRPGWYSLALAPLAALPVGFTLWRRRRKP